MKKHLLSFVFIILSISFYSSAQQTQVIDGNPGVNVDKCIAVDGKPGTPQEFFVIAYIDTSGGHIKVWLINEGSNGIPVWTKIFDTTLPYNGLMPALSAAATSNGNINVGLTIPSPSNTTIIDFNVDQNGNMVNATQISASGVNGTFADVSVSGDDGGNNIVTGSMLDQGTGTKKIFMTKLDSTGNPAWFKIYGSTVSGLSLAETGVTQNSSGPGYVVTGTASGGSFSHVQSVLMINDDNGIPQSVYLYGSTLGSISPHFVISNASIGNAVGGQFIDTAGKKSAFIMTLNATSGQVICSNRVVGSGEGSFNAGVNSPFTDTLYVVGETTSWSNGSGTAGLIARINLISGLVTEAKAFGGNGGNDGFNSVALSWGVLTAGGYNAGNAPAGSIYAWYLSAHLNNTAFRTENASLCVYDTAVPAIQPFGVIPLHSSVNTDSSGITFTPVSINISNGTISATQICGTLGLNEQSQAVQSISIFPNPSYGKLTFIFNRAVSDCTMRIFNTLGEQVYSEQFSSSDGVKEINLKAAEGIYFVQLSDGEGQTTYKIVLY